MNTLLKMENDIPEFQRLLPVPFGCKSLLYKVVSYFSKERDNQGTLAESTEGSLQMVMG